MKISSNLVYTESHEWILIENNVATIGITDYAQGELGDIVYFELPTVGNEAVKGKIFGTVEAVKTVADLYAPMSGTVTEVNQSLSDAPELVNHDPYGMGWLLRIELSNSAERNNLLSSDEYKDFLES